MNSPPLTKEEKKTPRMYKNHFDFEGFKNGTWKISVKQRQKRDEKPSEVKQKCSFSAFNHSPNGPFVQVLLCKTTYRPNP